jgi:hypothetical protein
MDAITLCRCHTSRNHVIYEVRNIKSRAEKLRFQFHIKPIIKNEFAWCYILYQFGLDIKIGGRAILLSLAFV